ncbi:hypothetical protein E6C27_scaffold269G00160 [Cucumis melo var. makuwa]|uniref:Uncharacterized protein n=1 Tax=Cucumis melo var. makuwa TaxID=1194695 RepID=A0A5A7SP54_CUCMM|nr:hypothetical protein E6C27_scaffold269G00160 [Cucumis melo var. makuwa]
MANARQEEFGDKLSVICTSKGGQVWTISDERLRRKLGSLKELQSSKVFLKLETWKKACIFKGASIFEDGRLQELRRLLSLGRILSRLSGIHRLGRSDQAPSSFGEVILPSAIQLLSGDDRVFAVRSTPGRSDRAPSSFGGVILPSAIQLSEDDRAFVVRSITLVGAVGHHHHLERSDQTPSSFGEVVLPSTIQLLSGDDRAFAIRSTALVGAIGHLRHLERWRQNCTIEVFLEKQRGGKATSTPMKPKVFKLA